MIGSKRHPAIFAGLMGSAAWATTPTIAFASPVETVIEAISHSLLLQFVVGCSLGAGVAGIVTLIADHKAKRDQALEEIESSFENSFWQTSSLDLVNAEKEAGEKDPTGDLGRYRTGKITIDVPQANKRRGGARHFATSKQEQHVIISDAKRAVEATSKRSGRHFATSESPVTKAAPANRSQRATTARGRHFATNVKTQKPVDIASVTAQKEAPAASGAANPTILINAQEQRGEQKRVVASRPTTTASETPTRMSRRERLLALPQIESHASTRSATPDKPLTPIQPTQRDMGQKVVRAQDTMDIARPEGAEAPTYQSPKERAMATSDKSEKLGITGRLSRKVRSVREVLAERLTENALEGVPIITRADGSAIDVGASWFDGTFVPAIANITGSHHIEDTTPRITNKTASVQTKTHDASRSDYISHRVAEINEGVFPERRTGKDLEHEDAWEQSMAAISETLDQENPVGEFKDMVGGPATIDDPDGMEAPTGFLPIRTRVVRSDVVDTETYVDYLLRDEISNNGSPVLAQLPHAHLRVIEGGTGKIAVRRSANDTGSIKPRGRHFAAQPLVAEAL